MGFNLDEKTKQYLGWLIVVVAILVAGALGIVYPVPPPPVGEGSGSVVLGADLAPGANLPNGARIGKGSTRIDIFPTPSRIEAQKGSVSQPPYSYFDDRDSGFYLVSDGNPAIAAAGSKVWDCTVSGCAGTLTTAAQTNITSLGTQSAALNMGNQVINNVGSADTDFNGAGGLTLADGITTTHAAIGGGYGNTGCTATSAGALSCDGALVGNSLTLTSTLNMQNAAITNIGNASTDFDTSGGLTTVYLTTTNNMNMNGATFSGPIKYGTQSTYTQGASITHGFATTPTVCIISPMQNITATYSLAETTFSTNMQSTSNPIYWMCGK